MPQSVSCPNCDHTLNLPDDSLGRKVKCPSCSAICRIVEDSDGYLMLDVIPEQPFAEDERRSPATRTKGRRPAARSASASTSSSTRKRGRESGRRKPSSRGSRATSRFDREPTGAGLILTLSILGFFLCGILSVIGYVKSQTFIKKCRRAGVKPSGTVVAASILGLIGTLLWFAWIIYALAIFPWHIL